MTPAISAAIPRAMLTAITLTAINPAIADMTFEAISLTNLGEQQNRAGIGWLDFDNDNKMDFYVSNVSGPNLLWRNLGDSNADGEHDGFTVVSPLLAPPLFGVESRGVLIADFNGDAYDDIFVANVGKNALFLNQKNGTGGHQGFLDVTDSWGLGGDTDGSHAACAGDVDADGDLDLLVVHWAEDITTPDGNDFYRNNLNPLSGGGSPTFSKVDVGLNQATQITFSCAFTDYNDDGFLDVILVNDNGRGNAQPVFYRNKGDIETGVFVQDTLAPTLDEVFAMGVAIGDFDGDRRMDYYFSNLVSPNGQLTNKLLRNDSSDASGNTLFVESESVGPTGITDPQQLISYWGASFDDLDNDADVDLYVVNAEQCTTCPATLYENDISESGLFTLVQNSGTDVLEGVGLANADFDSDGRMDMLVYGSNGDLTLLHNTTANAGHWVSMDLVSGDSNRRAVGARVEVTATISGVSKTQVRELVAGSSHSSTHSRRLHFGLGDAGQVNSISVRWPDQCVQTWTNLPVNSNYLLPDTCN